MKYLLKIILILPFLFLLYTPAIAVDSPHEMLTNQAEEARAQSIGKELRCLVCQNESIEDSSSKLAATLRKEVRGQVIQHKSNKEIHQWMIQHYGDYIELSPPLSAKSMPLWILPFLSTLVAIGIIFKLTKGRNS